VTASRARRKASSRPVPPVRVRLLYGAEIPLGPGKADLLEAIIDTGSISAAARRMGMSYRRAWLLVDTMNRCFEKPLVTAATGGSGGGRAQVTALGETVLKRYRGMERKALRAVAADVTAFAGLLTRRLPRS
jgi:molybdate transport system regulatory protein